MAKNAVPFSHMGGFFIFMQESELVLESERFKWYTRPKPTPSVINILEDYIGFGLDAYEVAVINNCSYETVCRTVAQYCTGVERPLTLPSRV